VSQTASAATVLFMHRMHHKGYCYIAQFDRREPQKRLEVHSVFTDGLQWCSLCWSITNV